MVFCLYFSVFFGSTLHFYFCAIGPWARLFVARFLRTIYSQASFYTSTLVTGTKLIARRTKFSRANKSQCDCRTSCDKITRIYLFSSHHSRKKSREAPKNGLDFQLQEEPIYTRISKLQPGKYTGILQSIRLIFKEEGVTAFWKGMKLSLDPQSQKICFYTQQNFREGANLKFTLGPLRQQKIRPLIFGRNYHRITGQNIRPGLLDLEMEKNPPKLKKRKQPSWENPSTQCSTRNQTWSKSYSNQLNNKTPFRSATLQRGQFQKCLSGKHKEWMGSRCRY